MRTAAQVAKEIEERTKPKVKAKGIVDKARMANARKVLDGLTHSLLPEEKFIRDRIEDGTCHEQPVSLNALGNPNVAYQARHIKLNHEHSSRFAAILLDGKELFPVVIFRSIVRSIINRVREEIVTMILADGFHRHHAYIKAGRTHIPAYVIDVSEDQLDSQARLFASMCNQLAVLKRTNDDKRAAIRMICEVPECEGWTNEQIATHCGVHEETASRVRMEWVIEHKKNLPRPGRRQPRPAVAGAKAKGPAPVAARMNVLLPGAEAEPAPTEIRPPLHNTRLFKDWLLKEGIVATSPAAGATTGLYINGLLAGDFAFVLCDGTDINDAYIAMAKALVLRNLIATGSRPAVVLKKQAAHQKLYQAGDGLGVDFLSPEELVSKVEGAANGKAI